MWRVIRNSIPHSKIIGFKIEIVCQIAKVRADSFNFDKGKNLHLSHFLSLIEAYYSKFHLNTLKALGLCKQGAPGRL